MACVCSQAWPSMRSATIGIIGFAPAAAMYQLLRPMRGLTSKKRARPSRGIDLDIEVCETAVAVLGQEGAGVAATAPGSPR